LNSVQVLEQRSSFLNSVQVKLEPAPACPAQERPPPLRGTSRASVGSRRLTMLWTLAVILVLLWALGLVSSYTMGGFIHILLVLAIIAVVVSLIRGRTTDPRL
jgi:hypothetical protein